MGMRTRKLEATGKRHRSLKDYYTEAAASRDKKAFFSDQCKEIEENNRMGKTRDLFKKIRDIKGTFMLRWAQ